MANKRQTNKPVRVWIAWWYNCTDGWTPFDAGINRNDMRDMVGVQKRDAPDLSYRITSALVQPPKGKRSAREDNNRG
jgi:hypothetical protein